MSDWTFPTTLEDFKKEGDANAQTLYNHICGYMNKATEHYNEVNQRLIEANTQLSELRGEVMVLETERTTLETQLALAQQTPIPVPQTPVNPPTLPPPPPPQNPHVPLAPAATQRSEKMPDPEKFSGDRAKLPDFLTQIRLKLMANKDRFLNTDALTMYVIPRLDGAALRQVATFISGTDIDFDSPVELREYLETSFGDPDPNGTARQELHELKQMKDFGAHHTEFRRIMGKLKYDDAAQMDCLEIE